MVKQLTTLYKFWDNDENKLHLFTNQYFNS